MPAYAYWSSSGGGTGAAHVADLPKISVAATPEPFGDSVQISWATPDVPPGMVIAGFVVTQASSSGAIEVCGSALQPLPADATECDVLGVADGDQSFTVRALVGTWTTHGDASATVAADRQPPTLALAAANADHAFLAAGPDHRLFFSPADAGGLALLATVDDAESGPASVTFPAVAAQGWSHPAETVTAGTPGPGGTTFLSSPFRFQPGASVPAGVQVVGTDNRGNTTALNVSVVADGTAPTGGALRVNGVAATGSGSTSYASLPFSVDSISPFQEAASPTQSGLEAVTLQRSTGVPTNGVCGSFDSPIDITGASAQAGLGTGCYRYSLVGTDHVGNASRLTTTVLVDTTPPVGGVVVANGTSSSAQGTESLSASGTWSLSRSDFTDPDSGVAGSVLTRSTAVLSDGSCGAFVSGATLNGSPGESSAPTGCYRYSLVGTNAAGLTASSVVTVQADRNEPTGGAMTVNGQSASASYPAVDSSTGSAAISALVPYVDGESGIQSTTVSVADAPMQDGACGSFGDDVVLDVAAPVTIQNLHDGCHRFTLTGTDRVGRSSAIGVIVRVDTSAPAGASLVVGGIDATTGTMAVSSSKYVDYSWVHFSDEESGTTAGQLKRVRSTSLSNGVCGTSFTSSSTLVSSAIPASGSGTDSLPTSGRCYRYDLTGTNGFGRSSTLSMYLMYDSTAPSASGSLVVNGTSATAGGGTSFSATGSVPVTQRRSYADPQSGIATDMLTRQASALTGGSCGAFGDGSELTGSVPFDDAGLTTGCYLYTQTGTNGVGTSNAVSTTVIVDTSPPVGGAMTANGVDASLEGTSSYSGTGSWSVMTTNPTDPDTGTSGTLTRATSSLSNGECGAFGGASIVTAPRTDSSSRGCYRYVFTGANDAGLTSDPVTTVVIADSSAPTGGSLTVNNRSARSNGSASGASGPFSIGRWVDYTDPHSGVADHSLTRTACDAPEGPAIAIDAPAPVQDLPAGCYRYTLSATNNAGLASEIYTEVTVS
jgi:hypothetical protein